MRGDKAALALLWLGACGGDDGGDFDMCEPADGIYEVRYVEKSGTCDLGKFTAVLAFGDFEGETSCTGPAETSDDGCTEQVNQRCVDGDGIVTKTVGTFRATKEDGSAFSGSAMVSVDLPNGISCSSRFDISGTRL